MRGRLFVDSNVFLYAIEEQDQSKSERAASWLRYLIASGLGISNLQVLNEVANVLLKRKVLADGDVFNLVDGFASFGTSPINTETTLAARLIRFETGYSWWDCMLLASAIELRCEAFLSEDLQDGHRIRGLTVINPFRHSAPLDRFH